MNIKKKRVKRLMSVNKQETVGMKREGQQVLIQPTVV